MSGKEYWLRDRATVKSPDKYDAAGHFAILIKGSQGQYSVANP